MTAWCSARHGCRLSPGGPSGRRGSLWVRDQRVARPKAPAGEAARYREGRCNNQRSPTVAGRRLGPPLRSLPDGGVAGSRVRRSCPVLSRTRLVSGLRRPSLRGWDWGRWRAQPSAWTGSCAGYAGLPPLLCLGPAIPGSAGAVSRPSSGKWRRRVPNGQRAGLVRSVKQRQQRMAESR